MNEYYGLEQAREAARDARALGELIKVPYETWSGKCHEVSFKLLSTGRFGPGRIARGWNPHITGQHSWIVLHHNVYAPSAIIVDPTLVPYMRREGEPTEGVEDIMVEEARRLSHRPHGAGSIWAAERPVCHGGEIIELTPSAELSGDAKLFLSEEFLGPLDRRGWGQLVHGPMEMWPAAEIIAAIDDTPALQALVPVDILGHLTDRNPGKCYLTEDLELRP